MECCCQRQHVNYYVRKLAGHGLTRSEGTQSSLSRRSESSNSLDSRRKSSSSSSTSHEDTTTVPHQSTTLSEVEGDPWRRYCDAYVLAGSLVSGCGRYLAAKYAYVVRISPSTARRASISGGPPSKRGTTLFIPREVELMV